MLPLSGIDLWNNFEFWLGFIFITFPLNLLVYGWNDIADFEIDQQNPRKGNFLFGARSTKKQIESLPKFITAIQLFFVIVFLFLRKFELIIWLLLMLIINGLYNKKQNGLRTLPPFELLAQLGYLLIVPFSIALNDVQNLNWMTYVYLWFFAMQSHLIGEVMDIDADRKTGRKTTATLLGVFKSKLIIIGIVAAEVSIMLFYFSDFYFGGFLAFALFWLLLDLFVIFKTNRYSLAQMKFFSFGSNAVAFATMIYIYFFGNWG